LRAFRLEPVFRGYVGDFWLREDIWFAWYGKLRSSSRQADS